MRDRYRADEACRTRTGRRRRQVIEPQIVNRARRVDDLDIVKLPGAVLTVGRVTSIPDHDSTSQSAAANLVAA